MSARICARWRLLTAATTNRLLAFEVLSFREKMGELLLHFPLDSPPTRNVSSLGPVAMSQRLRFQAEGPGLP